VKVGGKPVSILTIVSEGIFWDFKFFLGFIVASETEPLPTQDLKPQTDEASLCPPFLPTFFLCQ